MKWTDGNLLVTTAIGLRRLRRRGERVEQRVGERRRRVGAERPRRKVHVVLGEARDAERVVDEHLVVALRDAHRRQDRAGRVRPHQQVDLVDGDELLVERAREVGLRLVVLDDPLDRPAEQAAALVELLDVDLADELVDERRSRRAARSAPACCRCGSAGRQAPARAPAPGDGERERAASAARRVSCEVFIVPVSFGNVISSGRIVREAAPFNRPARPSA